MSKSVVLGRSAGTATVLCMMALLSACGGGGGGGSVGSTPPPVSLPAPAPTPSPTPAPSPTPTPAPTLDYKTTEYNDSSSPKFHGAATAWVQGATGAGSTIGIIDTGIFQANAEFTGRISSASTDIFASRGSVEGEDDHGTLVAMVAAADNNRSGTVGIAYDATILSIRADDPGSCASADDCSFGNLAQSINYAIDHGAKVINMSLGGSGASAGEIAAVKRAADNNVVVIVSAGNEGQAAPDAFAKQLATAGGGNVIIVGSVDTRGQISDFSNKAQGVTDSYLTALGEKVTVYLTGPKWASDPDCPSPALCLISGTSFSAPQVSGAVALLAQAFPTLTANEIVQILLDSATDAGDAGVDNVYGHGILDIAAAFAPKGTTSLAGTKTAMPLGDTSAVGSPAMGDALTTASVSAVVLDKYSRAYSTDLGLSMRSASITRRLQGAVGNSGRFVSTSTGNASLAFTIDDSARTSGVDAASQLRLTSEDAEAARVLAARIALRISPKSQLGFAYAEGPDGLVAQLQGQDRPAFLLAPQASGDDGEFRDTDVSLAWRQHLGNWGLTISGESGEVVSGAPIDLADQGRADRKSDGVYGFGASLDREFGDLQTALGLNWVKEDRTVLGARFHDAFGGGGSQSLFLDVNAGWALADRWRLNAALRNGWTLPDRVGLISDGSQIYSRAWSVDLERRGIFGPNDALGLRLAQPLRVESGKLNLNLPIAYDYTDQSATFGLRPIALSPSGREIVGEIAWRGPMLGGSASASMFYRRDPGHYASVPDDKGVALRWNTRF